MKVVILAGGIGSRLSEETILKPKPMVEIGGKPIIWHIMKIFSSYGFNDFIICCGYKGYLIKEYFLNYHLHTSDVEIDLYSNNISYFNKITESWNIKLIDTGQQAMTGGRIKRISDHIDSDDFLMTYGDGVANINLSKLVAFHQKHKKLATVTSVFAPGRFGGMTLNENKVTNFTEKPKGDGKRINGGFFVLNKKVINLINDDLTIWENEPINRLAESGELYAYLHDDFWHPMDTIRDKVYLEELWNSKDCPWKIW